MVTYAVYWNSGTGGPVDYGTPLASGLTATSYLTAALAHPGDYTFAVRASDAGLEELNTDARWRLVLDASGADVTNRPPAPSGLSAQPLAAGAVRVSWRYAPAVGDPLPTSFKVWCRTPGPVNYAASPAATAAFAPGRLDYSVDVPGLVDGATYLVAVRATNASGDEPNVDTASVVADASGPLPVANLIAEATY